MMKKAADPSSRTEDAKPLAFEASPCCVSELEQAPAAGGAGGSQSSARPHSEQPQARPARGWTDRTGGRPSGPPNASECTVVGLSTVSPHLVSRFTIRHARNVQGLEFKVSVASDTKVQFGNVVDVGNGTYTALFCVRYVASSVKVNVTLNNAHVVGSPFTVPVSMNAGQEGDKKKKTGVEPLMPYH